jgi:ankyrin repeat protein
MGETALMLACVHGQLGVVQRLLQLPRRILNVDAQNRHGWTALIIAAGAGNLAIVRELVLVGRAALSIRRNNKFNAVSEAVRFGAARSGGGGGGGGGGADAASQATCTWSSFSWRRAQSPTGPARGSPP